MLRGSNFSGSKESSPENVDFEVTRCENVLDETLILMHNMSRLASLVFSVASPCLWGKLQNLSCFKVPKQFYILHSELHTLFTLTLHTLHCTPQTQHSTLYTLHFTLHTLYTPHSLHSTLHTLHMTLHTLHSTLCTPPLTAFRFVGCIVVFVANLR